MEIVFTDRELDVMEVLWTRGDATVAEVQTHLNDSLAYTTVLTVLRTLEEKGRVGHDEEGRAHRYRPLVERGRAQGSALRRLVGRVFSGSPEALMTHLVADGRLTEEQLRGMRETLDRRLGEGGDEGPSDPPPPAKEEAAP